MESSNQPSQKNARCNIPLEDLLQRENSKEVMKEPIVALQVPRRNKNGNEDSNNESVIQDKTVCNRNDPSGLETREGTRATFQADFNAERPTEASVTEDTT